MRVKIGPYKTRGERLVEVHVHDYDTWNLDHTLALIILPALRTFRENVNSVPGNFYNPETDVANFAGWEEMLDDMIWSFEQIVDDTKEEEYYGDFEGMRAYHKRIDVGLQLFGEYFRNLWN